VDISEERTEPDRKNSDTSEDDESECDDGVSYFENITGARDQNPVIYPELHKEDSEVDYFLSILADEILEIIRDKTNLYVTQAPERRLGVVRLDSCNLKPTTVEEIKTFIAIRILMGIHTLPQLRHYLSCDNLLGSPAVSNLITKTMFKKLTENIHCNDNTKAVATNNLQITTGNRCSE
jgi:hypothetical protein